MPHAMKRSFPALVALAAAVLLVLAAGAARPAGAATSGLVGAYSFNSVSSGTVADSSGSGNTGRLSNATAASAGKFGGALSFNGSNSLVNVADAASLDLSKSMTLEAWVKPSALAPRAHESPLTKT